MAFATIDVGTNTAQLLVVKTDGSNLERLHVAERFIRLGEGVDADGRIGDDAQERLLHVMREYVTVARDYAANPIVAAGTSALRDATNRDDVCARVRNDVGIHMEVLTGEEEATWSFAAACSAFPDRGDECLVVDVGGGSTELILGTMPQIDPPRYSERIIDRASLNVGCVRLTERCFAQQPPDPASVEQATAIIDDALTDSSLPIAPNATMIGTAGTATALALVHLGPDASWDALHGDGFTLSFSDVQGWRQQLTGLTVDDVRALRPSAMHGRADVFPAGVLLLERIMTHYDKDELSVSAYELRHGLALRHLSTGT